MIDLHLHSTASDGTLTTQEIIAFAKQAGLTAISLTDHDSVAGLASARKLALEQQINFIDGIEFSTSMHLHDLHILGYFINWRSKKLKQILSDLTLSRLNRAEKIINKLCLLGLELNLEEVKAIAGKGPIGRPHIALALVYKGLVPDVKEAFNHYLSKGKPAYVAKKLLKVEKVINLVHELNGLAVLAHPGLINASQTELTQLITELTACGLDGLELYHPEHSLEKQTFFKALAAQLGLVITGGSDCHGLAKPRGISIGKVKVPDAVFFQLNERHRQFLSTKAFPLNLN